MIDSPDFSQALIQELDAELGGTVSELEPILHGTTHRMFSACWQPNAETNTPIIIRFSHGPRAVEDARLEASALRAMSRTRYPAPELFMLSDPPNGLPYIVMQRLPGEPLTQVAAAHPEQIPQWLDKASDLLLRLHGLDWHKGYEAFNPVLEPLDFAERQIRWWKKSAQNIDDPLLINGFNWLTSHLYGAKRCRQQTLVHRDFYSDNILTEGTHITGVVDWGGLTIADPAMDIGWTRMLLTANANVALGDSFIESYTRRNPNVRETLPFWEVFAGCKRLTAIGLIRANQSERLSMWANAPDVARLVDTDNAVRTFLQSRLIDEDND
jgi:aminoglycoside phosphotransferase (APT) family kinase protein